MSLTWKTIHSDTALDGILFKHKLEQQIIKANLSGSPQPLCLLIATVTCTHNALTSGLDQLSSPLNHGICVKKQPNNNNKKTMQKI